MVCGWWSNLWETKKNFNGKWTLISFSRCETPLLIWTNCTHSTRLVDCEHCNLSWKNRSSPVQMSWIRKCVESVRSAEFNFDVQFRRRKNKQKDQTKELIRISTPGKNIPRNHIKISQSMSRYIAHTDNKIDIWI